MFSVLECVWIIDIFVDLVVMLCVIYVWYFKVCVDMMVWDFFMCVCMMFVCDVLVYMWFSVGEIGVCVGY